MSVTTIGEFGASDPVTIADPVTNNAKGAWTEIVAATPSQAHGFGVYTFTGGANSDVLFDIGTGPSGAETVLVGNVYSQDNNSTGQIKNFYYFPVAVPAGTRVAVRCQSTSTAVDFAVAIYLCLNVNNVPFENLTPTTYGANTADSGGVQVDPGGTANTKGAYSEIAAATTDRIDWLYVNLGNRNNGAMTSAAWRCDIAIGASGQETIVIQDLCFRAHANHDLILPQLSGPFPVEIAPGTRLSARALCSTIDATDRLFDITILGYAGAWRRHRRLN